MKLSTWLLVIFALTLPVVAQAKDGIEKCQSYLKTAIGLIENLESTLPEIPNESDILFKKKHDSMGMPKFNSLRGQPHFYLWLLAYDLKKAKSFLETQAGGLSNPDARNTLGAVGRTSYLLSNLRNSWTEYAAYSEDKNITDAQQNSISDDMHSVNGIFDIYASCLVAQLP